MTADLGLVAHAAERDAPVAPAHGASDRTAERGLADAGRTDEQQDRPALVAAQLADGRVLDDALLHALETEVILVEAAPHLAHVHAVGRGPGPGQIREPLHVVAGDLILGRLRLHAAEPRELLLGDALGVRRQLGAADALAQLLDLVVVGALAELLADRAHLLAQHVVALRAAELVLHLGGDLLANLQHLELAIDHRRAPAARAP